MNLTLLLMTLEHVSKKILRKIVRLITIIMPNCYSNEKNQFNNYIYVLAYY